MVKERLVMALVILAHYAVVLFRLRDHLWQSRGGGIKRAVSDRLGDERVDCMEWPMIQIRRRTENTGL
jgi:hypothetical protein